MSELARLILLLVLAGGGLTALGGGAIWYMEEGRRVRRALRRVLGAEPEGLLLAPGTGRGTAFAFAGGQIAVAWDSGAWCLVYPLDELVGAELTADGEVVGRVHRGESRRALDRAPREAQQITLRILFDDPAHPDFELELWDAEAPRREGAAATPAGAVQEANRWLARAEAILRRQGGQPPSPPTAVRADPRRAPPPADDEDDKDDDAIEPDAANDEDEAPF
jgi:hypothetical protein